MSDYKVFRLKDVNLDFPDGADVGSNLVRYVDETHSQHLGAGVFRVHGISNELVLPYDEACVCLQGTLKLTLEGEQVDLAVGDAAWIPKGTRAVFSGDNAVAFYGIYPVDWRSKS